jgi:ribosomal protein L14
MGVLSIVNCVDNTGVVFVKIIKVFGHTNKRFAKIGDRISLVISSINLNTKNMKDHRRRHKLRRGTIHRGIVIQTKQRFFRKNRT